MRHWKKIGLILLFIFLGFIIHIFLSTGFFRKIENHFEGEIVKTITLPGAEDIMVSLKDSFAIISSTKRSFSKLRDKDTGGLFYMELKSGDFKVTPLTSSFEKLFAPHGISMIEKGESYKIMAINHSPQGHSIEVFNLNGANLTFKKTLTDPSMISPNDLVIIDDDKFYFTNDHGYTKGIGKFFEEYGGLAVSNVVYFDGKNYKEVASGIAYANGINFDRKRNLLFVASVREFIIKVYSVNKDGSLDFIENIKCGTGIDNIDIDKEGNLWMGAHPNLLTFAAYAQKKKKNSPSEIIKVNYKGKGDYSIEKIFLDDGNRMSGSSVAVPFGDLIITGNVMDDKFLILKK